MVALLICSLCWIAVASGAHVLMGLLAPQAHAWLCRKAKKRRSWLRRAPGLLAFIIGAAAIIRRLHPWPALDGVALGLWDFSLHLVVQVFLAWWDDDDDDGRRRRRRSAPATLKWMPVRAS